MFLRTLDFAFLLLYNNEMYGSLVVRSAAGLWATQGAPEEAELGRHNVDKHCAYLQVVSGLVARGGTMAREVVREDGRRRGHRPAPVPQPRERDGH